MTTIDRDHVGVLAGELADIRDALEELQSRFERVMRDVRDLPGGELQHARIDAYPGIRLDRDMGAGLGAVEWIEEVGTFLEQLADGDPGDHAHPGSGDVIGADRAEHEAPERERDIDRARALRAQGESLHAIAVATGRSKEWLRTYAGITD